MVLLLVSSGLTHQTEAAGGQFMTPLLVMAGVFGSLFIQPTFLQEIGVGLFTWSS